MLSHLFLGFVGQKYTIFVLMSENWCMSEIRCTSVKGQVPHTAIRREEVQGLAKSRPALTEVPWVFS